MGDFASKIPNCEAQCRQDAGKVKHQALRTQQVHETAAKRWPQSGTDAVQQQQPAGDFKHPVRVDQVVHMGYAQAINREHQAAVQSAQHNQPVFILARQVKTCSGHDGTHRANPKQDPAPVASV